MPKLKSDRESIEKYCKKLGFTATDKSQPSGQFVLFEKDDMAFILSFLFGTHMYIQNANNDQFATDSRRVDFDINEERKTVSCYLKKGASVTITIKR